MVNILVLMTCHSRRDSTLAAIRSLYGASASMASLNLILVDDGSTDGTAEAVAGEFPDVRVVPGDGNLYWAGGMRLAQESAGDSLMTCDFVLLFNDDTKLFGDAMAQLVQTSMDRSAEIVAGVTVDPTTGEPTYGGVVRRGWLRRLSFIPAGFDREADSFSANAALISRACFEAMEGLAGPYTHSMADTDFGLRAGRKGYRIWTTPQPVGVCVINDLSGTWWDPTLPRRERWRLLRSPKGLPPREWAHFTLSFGGVLGPVYAVMPILRIVVGR